MSPGVNSPALQIFDFRTFSYVSGISSFVPVAIIRPPLIAKASAVLFIGSRLIIFPFLKLRSADSDGITVALKDI